MEIADAIAFLADAGPFAAGTWADIGAGTGTFTLALNKLLPPESTIYALDKHPIGLYRLSWPGPTSLQIVDADFNHDLDLPPLEGMLMANALHYSPDPHKTLTNVLASLRPGGTFILIEYDLETARGPWVPFPVSWQKFRLLAQEVGLQEPIEIHRRPSAYGHQQLYSAVAHKPQN